MADQSSGTTPGGPTSPGPGASGALSTVQAAYDALGRGDLLSFLTALDDQVEWFRPGGEGQPSGVRRGQIAVVQDLIQGTPEVGPLAYTPSQFLAGPEHVVVLGRTTAGASGPAGRFAHVWLMADSRGREVHLFDDGLPRPAGPPPESRE